MKAMIPLMTALMMVLPGAEERRPVREPTYKSGRPTYALLEFGADDKFRIWLVQDGDKLYVDRNGNGDLTEPDDVVRPLPTGVIDEGEGAAKVGYLVESLRQPDGKHGRLLLDQIKDKGDAKKVRWRLTVDPEDGFEQTALDVVFAARPEDAPVVHFGDPLEPSLFDPATTVLDRGETPNELYVVVGTRGSKGVFATIPYSAVPRKAHPVAEIAWPGAGPEGTTLREKVALDQRC